MLILSYIGGALNRNIVNQAHEQLAEQVGSAAPCLAVCCTGLRLP